MAETTKLTEMQVRVIRAHPELPVSVFARLYRVAGETVRRARTGETWGWLDAHLKEEKAPPLVQASEEELLKSVAKIITPQERQDLDPMTQEILDKYSDGRG